MRSRYKKKRCHKTRSVSTTTRCHVTVARLTDALDWHMHAPYRKDFFLIKNNLIVFRRALKPRTHFWEELAIFNQVHIITLPVFSHRINKHGRHRTQKTRRLRSSLVVTGGASGLGGRPGRRRPNPERHHQKELMLPTVHRLERTPSWSEAEKRVFRIAPL